MYLVTLGNRGNGVQRTSSDRRGVIEAANELELLPSDDTERDPVLAQLTAAAPKLS